MEVKLIEMHSIQDALRTLYLSKRSWNEKKENELELYCNQNVSPNGKPYRNENLIALTYEAFNRECDKLFKWGRKHTTMLRFLTMSVVVQGLHRGATDDFDSHAKRLENKIIRSSTRLANYESGEKSDWYKDKIITTDEALNMLGISIPEYITADNGDEYVRAVNGYVREDMKDNKDVLRGLYMLSIPVDFTFQVNVIEFAHIYRERGSKAGGANGTAAPELQEMVESLASQLEEWYPQLTREYLLSICN